MLTQHPDILKGLLALAMGEHGRKSINGVPVAALMGFEVRRRRPVLPVRLTGVVAALRAVVGDGDPSADASPLRDAVEEKP